MLKFCLFLLLFEQIPLVILFSLSVYVISVFFYEISADKMEKFNLSKMSDDEIQDLFDSVNLDLFDQSGDEVEFADDESMDEDDGPVISASLIKEAITANLVETVEEFETEKSRAEPGPSSKCKKNWFSPYRLFILYA